MRAMNEFDIKAKDWDSNIRHVDRAVSVAKSIRKALPLNKNMSAMEYGAGTGLLSIELKDYLKSIVLMDSSEGMVKVTASKIADSGFSNLISMLWDLEKNNFNAGFDLIFNLMVLHHVSDIDILIHRFYSLLNKGGFIAIADLYPEDGTFHGPDFKGYFGFDPDQLGNFLLAKGFHNVRHEECYNVNKIASDGTVRDFPVFLLTGEK